MALTGTERLQPVGRRLPRYHRITVEFGMPLHWAQPPPEMSPAQARRAATDKIVQTIGALSGQEYAEVYGATLEAVAHHPCTALRRGRCRATTERVAQISGVPGVVIRQTARP